MSHFFHTFSVEFAAFRIIENIQDSVLEILINLLDLIKKTGKIFL